MLISVSTGHSGAQSKAPLPAARSSWLTVDNLGDCKVHGGGDGSDGLVLCQVEGTHGKVSRVVVRHSEGHVQAGHLVDLTRILKC